MWFHFFQKKIKLSRKEKFNPYRKAIPRFSTLPLEEQQRLLSENPAYGRIICQLEMITEGEVIEAIRRGATTVDGIKFRTRVGMGPCQGDYCYPKLVKILARELGIDPSEVRKGPSLFLGL